MWWHKHETYDLTTCTPSGHFDTVHMDDFIKLWPAPYNTHITPTHLHIYNPTFVLHMTHIQSNIHCSCRLAGVDLCELY